MSNGKLLVVEDDLDHQDLLVEFLDGAGYSTVAAGDGGSACAQMGLDLDAVLLDRGLPDLDGMEVLRKIKANPQWQYLPVILQTGAANPQDIEEGLKAGAYYYLTKPLRRDTLLSVVGAAVAEYRNYRELQAEIRQHTNALKHMVSGVFRYSTLDACRTLTGLLANACSQPEKVVMGLSELLVNALEHGNLGVGYDLKSALQAENRWQEEIERRQALPEHAGKYVEVAFERGPAFVRFMVQDQGAGFDWRQYLDIDPDRAFDTHGRGIALARILSFDALDYQDGGRRVVATVNL